GLTAQVVEAGTVGQGTGRHGDLLSCAAWVRIDRPRGGRASSLALDRWAVPSPRTGGALRADKDATSMSEIDEVGAGRFPAAFEWGTATAAHQIEGGNWNNDWWRWEHTPGSPCSEPSGDACDSWNRWIEDVGLVTDLGLDNYRFSIEWSRIEPEEGEYSTVAIDHY